MTQRVFLDSSLCVYTPLLYLIISNYKSLVLCFSLTFFLPLTLNWLWQTSDRCPSRGLGPPEASSCFLPNVTKCLPIGVCVAFGVSF